MSSPSSSCLSSSSLIMSSPCCSVTSLMSVFNRLWPLVDQHATSSYVEKITGFKYEVLNGKIKDIVDCINSLSQATPSITSMSARLEARTSINSDSPVCFTSRLSIHQDVNQFGLSGLIYLPSVHPPGRQSIRTLRFVLPPRGGLILTNFFSSI